ncbi:FAD binding domain-containing protein [Xylariaceae sp. FL0594]|nr:FAD binding domain-containing protein [Xylariaceae sp. FL0594]
MEIILTPNTQREKMADPPKAVGVDVLVVGAGPVGLIMAYQLAKFGLSVRIVEKHTKSAQDAHGRAITLFPRTTELLAQLGLADELIVKKEAFLCRETAAYNAHGEEVSSRGGWSFMSRMNDTEYDFALVLRQRFQEEVYREALKSRGVVVEAPVEFIGAEFSSDDDGNGGEYGVTARVKNISTGEEESIRCRCLIGADGGHSAVRRSLGIPFEGSTTEDRWVRIDGNVRTNHPKPRTYCSIESPTHGNVLWAPLDRGATRIGFAFTDQHSRYKNQRPDTTVFDQEAAIREAVQAVRPFSLEFETVDWWTIYTVGRRIAKHFSARRNRVFLVGDAAHTHSSGAAQGLNTGIHDAVNLAWKLALVLRGAVRRRGREVEMLLASYEAERRPVVEKLLKYDADISRLMTNRLPENWRGDPNADVNEVLGKVMQDAGSFNSGLGIAYPARGDNPLVVDDGGSHSEDRLHPGMRAPDITLLLLLPGATKKNKTTLMRQTPNMCCFYIVFFAPSTSSPGTTMKAVQAGVEGSVLLKALVENGVLAYLTISISTPASDSDLSLTNNSASIGRAYCDTPDGAGYKRYGVDPARGRVIVIRPDGWVCAMLSLDRRDHHAAVVGELEGVFERMGLLPST